MQVEGSVALVTGANRGLGAAFVQELLAQGATKVYAGARNPVPSDDERIVAVRLDVTDESQVAAVAAVATDVTIVINNAGSHSGASIIDGSFADIRADFDANFYGPIVVTRAFASILAANGGGAVLNVHSALSWLSAGNGYSASKAAIWSATNALRVALAPANTLVTGLHVGYIDTDMTAGLDVAKVSPQDVARAGVDGIGADLTEVLADDTSRWVKAQLSGELEALYPALAPTPA